MARRFVHAGRLILMLGPLAVSGLPSGAAAQLRLRPADGRFWLAGAAAIAAAAAADEPLDRAERRHPSHLADRLGDAGNVLGTGRYLIAGMAASYVAARATGHRAWSRNVIDAAMAYTVGNVLESALKPGVGRHRPDSTGDAWRFRPFSGAGAWHSFPSAHAMHAFTLADAIAMSTDRRWLAGAAYGAAGLVAWSRTYRHEHWASDVTASAVLGIAASRTIIGWHREHHGTASTSDHWRVALGAREGTLRLSLAR